MLAVGDVLGKIRQYLARIEGASSSFQIGDMGLGFKGVQLPELERKHRWFRGNHDNPSVCKQHPNYAGDYAYDPEHELFWIAGAWSIDQAYRIPGVSWWFDEELTYDEFQKAKELYLEKKPKVVLSHDCPEMIGGLVVERGPGFYIIGDDGTPKLAGKIRTRTGQCLQEMWEAHQPELWIFGHYHLSFDHKLNDTRFICLNELETFSF